MNISFNLFQHDFIIIDQNLEAGNEYHIFCQSVPKKFVEDLWHCQNLYLLLIADTFVAYGIKTFVHKINVGG